MKLKELRCLWDNVLVLVDRGGVEKKSPGGMIVMPATAKPGHRRQGEIVAIGPGKREFHDGEWVTRPMTVKPGQAVTFEIGSGTVFPDDDGKEYVMLVEEQITGVFPSADELREQQRNMDETWAANQASARLGA